MTCPICNQKPMNCDCTQREREQFDELQELREQLTNEVRDELRQAEERGARSAFEHYARRWQHMNDQDRTEYVDDMMIEWRKGEGKT